ncbi:MAG: hypothetical protein QOJ97_2747 [Solirubrobacteraceae bacterium]|jgi:hypothetical protein|nr:hypothetical protein [Solirubrobacteraceae bacterium]
MRTAPLSPAQAAALRRARELVAELTELTASIRSALRDEVSAGPRAEAGRFAPPVAEASSSAPALLEPPLADPEDETASGLAAGDLRAAFAAAKPGAGPRRRPRELFGH